MDSFVLEFGTLLLIIVGISYIVKLFKQPIIIGYIISGILFSILARTTGFNTDLIIVMSELGITFLLFLMGVEFDLKSLKYMGKDIFITCVQQSVVFFGVGYGVAYLFGFSVKECVYLAILFMFSSTLLVAKWVENKKETTTLHGKIILGTLIIQDVIAIIALTILGVVKEKSWIKILLSPAEGLVMVLIAFILAKYVLDWLMKKVRKYPEMVFIFSLGLCFLFVRIAALLNYSTTIGAFIAGVTLGNTLYKSDILPRLKPLIIFFNMLFFVGLGFQMNFAINYMYLVFIGLLIVLGLVIKPIVIFTTLRIRGYDPKSSFITGMALSQMSEFGIIIIAAATPMLGSYISAIGIITVILSMVVSSYFIKSDKALFNFFEPFIRKTDIFFKTKKVDDKKIDEEYNFLFFGYYDLGKDIYSKLGSMGKKILVIESDPENIEILEKEKIPYVYNSVRNHEFFEQLKFEKVELIVSSIIDIDDNKMIIEELKKANKKAMAIVTAKSLKDSLLLYKYNADYVIYPSYLNEQKVSVLLEDYTQDINKVIAKKLQDMAHFKEADEKMKGVNDNSVFTNIEQMMNKWALTQGKK